MDNVAVAADLSSRFPVVCPPLPHADPVSANVLGGGRGPINANNSGAPSGKSAASSFASALDYKSRALKVRRAAAAASPASSPPAAATPHKLPWSAGEESGSEDSDHESAAAAAAAAASPPTQVTQAPSRVRLAMMAALDYRKSQAAATRAAADAAAASARSGTRPGSPRAKGSGSGGSGSGQAAWITASSAVVSRAASPAAAAAKEGAEGTQPTAVPVAAAAAAGAAAPASQPKPRQDGPAGAEELSNIIEHRMTGVPSFQDEALGPAVELEVAGV